MGYFIVAVAAFVAGGACAYVALMQFHSGAKESLDRAATESSLAASQMARAAQLEQERREALRSLGEQSSEFAARVVSYDELQNEVAMLKQDLLNLHVANRKAVIDRQHMEAARKEAEASHRAEAANLAANRREFEASQQVVMGKIETLGRLYLGENVKWIAKGLNATNYETCKKRLDTVIQRCRGIGLNIDPEEERVLHEDLKEQFRVAVRVQFEREEQARIRAKVREEAKLQAEANRVVEQVEREKQAVQAALAKASSAEEIAMLQQKLAEAEARSQRAISQAQLTKAGNVYVISNIGAFGENVFKIGVTRRLEPFDRVAELADASVPFPFDVHMMIASDDAPALEHALHKRFRNQQLNKTNPKKEFFRASIEDIAAVVRECHGKVEYTATPEALQYRQSLEMPDEDLDFIEDVYENVSDEDGVPEE